MTFISEFAASMQPPTKQRLLADVTFALNKARTARTLHEEMHRNENSYQWMHLEDVVQTLEGVLEDLQHLKC